MGLRIKNFNIFEVHGKLQFLEGGLQKTKIEEGIAWKGGLGQFADLGGGGG